MNLSLNDLDCQFSFSVLRRLIPLLDQECKTRWEYSPLTRAVFLRPGSSKESLSEQQNPNNQLRFYTKNRILRGLRGVAEDFAERISQPLSIRLNALPGEPDSLFLNWLVDRGVVKVYVDSKRDARGHLEVDKISSHLYKLRDEIGNGIITADDLINEISILLSCGDSWNAKSLAEVYLSITPQVDSSLACVLGTAYALQEYTGEAKLLWEIWQNNSTIDEARAKYSLAMLEARHHPLSLLDQKKAETLLEEAWDILVSLPDSVDTHYEQIFNRNGVALLYFRSGRLEKAEKVLTEGIDFLRSSEYAKGVHQTVLTSNLARVIALKGETEYAEKLFKETISLDPKFAEYHQDYANFLCDLERFAEAKFEIEASIELDPSIPEAHRLLGFICNQLGEYADSYKAYYRAIQLGDTDAIVEIFRVAHLAEMAEKIIEIKEIVDIAILSHDEQAEIELIYLQARCSLYSDINAIEELEKLLLQFPDSDLVAETLELNK